jgi:hypothetical protein
LILKELADNGLDSDAQVKVGEADGAYFVEDDGPGIDPDAVPRLFSIARDLESTKLWRLPTRGALGNGLRVVASGVLVSGGSLTVTTRNRKLRLQPERDGTTTVISDEPVDYPRGTRIDIALGTLPKDEGALHWARIAISMGGRSYSGKTSPWWYDAPNFHELLFAGGERPVRDLVASLDGCSGARASDIVREAGLGRMTCAKVNREQAKTLLRTARSHASPVSPKRLSGVGPVGMAGQYSRQTGDIDGVPYLIEAWVSASLAEHDEPVTVFCVHDADAAGTMIYQTLQEETKARSARKVQIVNLGLEVDEAEDMGLEVEEIEETDRRKPVADYAQEWEEWLQTHRVELNAMTTPQFIEWLDEKMADHDKLIPPAAVLEKELADRIESKVRAELTERILREAGFDSQVTAALAAIAKPDADALRNGVEKMFEEQPEQEWRAHIEAEATRLSGEG